MQSKNRENFRRPSSKRTRQPGKWDHVRALPDQVVVLNVAVEQIAYAAVHGEQLLYSPGHVSVMEEVLVKTNSVGKLCIGHYHPIFDEVRMHPSQVSALAALGVNYRELLGTILSAKDEDGQTQVFLGPRITTKGYNSLGTHKRDVDVQAVVIDVDALYAAIRFLLNSKGEQA